MDPENAQKEYYEAFHVAMKDFLRSRDSNLKKSLELGFPVPSLSLDLTDIDFQYYCRLLAQKTFPLMDETSEESFIR